MFIFQVKIAKNNDRVVGLDGDMKNSTFSEKLRNTFPERHVECFICEQNMAGVSTVNDHNPNVRNPNYCMLKSERNPVRFGSEFLGRKPNALKPN